MTRKPLALLVFLALLILGACATPKPQEQASPPPDGGTSNPAGESAPSPKPTVIGTLPPLPAEYEEAIFDLAGGQALVLRLHPFQGVEETFHVALVDRSSMNILDETRDYYTLFAEKKVALEDLGCEVVSVGGPWEPELTSSRTLRVLTTTCEVGNDARSFTPVLYIVEVPKGPIAKLSELKLIWRGRGPEISNIHDMCISGYKAKLVEKEGKLQMTYAPFAEFQPDPEFGAVDEKDCVAPEAKAPMVLER